MSRGARLPLSRARSLEAHAGSQVRDGQSLHRSKEIGELRGQKIAAAQKER